MSLFSYVKKLFQLLFSHVGLCLLVSGYCAGGAFLFQYFELPYEKAFKGKHINQSLEMELKKEQLIAELLVVPETSANRSDLVTELVENYHSNFSDAVQNAGYKGSVIVEEEIQWEWSFISALLFTVTIVTTIGYGHISPDTPEGQLLTIVYSLVGIPLMLMFLANMGDVMAKCFRVGYSRGCCFICWKRRGKQYVESRRRMTGSPEDFENTFAAYLSRRSVAADTAAQPNTDTDTEEKHIEIKQLSDKAEVIEIGEKNGTVQLPGTPDSGCQEVEDSPVFRPKTGSFNQPRVRFRSEVQERKISVVAVSPDRALLRSESQRRGSSSAEKRKSMSLERRVATPYPEPVLLKRPLTSTSNHELAAIPPLPTGRRPSMFPPPPVGSAHPEQQDYTRRQSTKSRMSYHSDGSASEPDQPDDEDASVPISLAIVVIIVYNCMGALLFAVWNDWSFVTAVYFCFVTLSTIGFGDFIPGLSEVGSTMGNFKFFMSILYIILGMAVLSMCFNLMVEEMISKFKSIGKKLGIISERRESDDDDADVPVQPPPPPPPPPVSDGGSSSRQSSLRRQSTKSVLHTAPVEGEIMDV